MLGRSTIAPASSSWAASDPEQPAARRTVRMLARRPRCTTLARIPPGHLLVAGCPTASLDTRSSILRLGAYARFATLRSILGLLAAVALAVPQRLQPHPQVLDQGGVRALVEVVQLVGVVHQVVELLLPVAVLYVFVRGGPDSPERGLV